MKAILGYIGDTHRRVKGGTRLTGRKQRLLQGRDQGVFQRLRFDQPLQRTLKPGRFGSFELVAAPVPDKPVRHDLHSSGKNNDQRTGFRYSLAGQRAPLQRRDQLLAIECRLLDGIEVKNEGLS
jgi:hypothetical protein